MTNITVTGNDGEHSFDLAQIFAVAKRSVAADYRSDRAVGAAIKLHGDVAERDFTNALQALNMAKCAEVSGDAIRTTISSQARMSIILTCLSWARRRSN